jgi:hypothetical protein
MSHFAKIENGIVTQVIVAEQDVINSGLFGAPHTWIQTSYNTRDGVHVLGGTPLRKNFAGVGYTYDPVADEFNPPTPSTPVNNQVVQNNDVITTTAPTATVTVTTSTASDTITLTTASETITL